MELLNMSYLKAFIYAWNTFPKISKHLLLKMQVSTHTQFLRQAFSDHPQALVSCFSSFTQFHASQGYN